MFGFISSWLRNQIWSQQTAQAACDRTQKCHSVGL